MVAELSAEERRHSREQNLTAMSVEHSQLPAENPEGGNTGSYRNRVKNIYIPLPFFVAASYLLVCYVVNRIHTEIILQR